MDQTENDLLVYAISPSWTVIGSLSRNRVCFQCVGTDAGPVLKLINFGFGFFNGSPELIRLD